jgi:GAF domain-containing protein
MPASLNAFESERLAALTALRVLDTPAEKIFDDLVEAAALALDAKIALVSLVDADRQWFKARRGLNACETSRDVAFCAYALETPDPFIVPNALNDDRFKDNPLVTGAPFIRFYAGAPLIAPSGHAVGTLCVIDDEPRFGLAERETALLTTFAGMVMERLLKRLETMDADAA